MNLFIIASFIILSITISVNVKKQAKNARQRDADFWSREYQANSVRRKPLDNLNYITIPLETFPTHLLNDDPKVLEYISTIEALTSRKIVNLTGFSNTDLKLEYGTANLEPLTEYDQNYTVLVRTLQQWADALIEAGYQTEAATLMEFALSTGTDISRTYYLLADYWVSKGREELIDYLYQTAENLRSSNKEIILRHLREKYPRVF